MFARMTGAVAAAAMMLAGVAAAGETAEPGYVRGTVKTAAGAPIPGALIFIDGVLDQNFQFTTKEDGAFNIRLQPGAYVAQATLSYKWEGQTYKFDLRPDSTDTFDDSTGAVRNFTWALTGEKPQPQMGSYGGFVYVDIGTDNFYLEDQDNITWTLEPVGTLIDGSQGEAIVRKGGAPRTAEYGKILDVPVGRYKISGVYAPPGMKPQVLKFRNSWARNKAGYAEQAEILLVAEGNFCNLCASVEIESPTQPEPQ